MLTPVGVQRNSFDGDVAVVGSDHASVVDSLADLTDLFFDFVLCCHFGYSFNLKIFVEIQVIL